MNIYVTCILIPWLEFLTPVCFKNVSTKSLAGKTTHIIECFISICGHATNTNSISSVSTNTSFIIHYKCYSGNEGARNFRLQFLGGDSQSFRVASHHTLSFPFSSLFYSIRNKEELGCKSYLIESLFYNF